MREADWSGPPPLAWRRGLPVLQTTAPERGQGGLVSVRVEEPLRYLGTTNDRAVTSTAPSAHPIVVGTDQTRT